MSEVSGVALGTLAIGGVLMWSGLKGASLLTTVQEAIQGKKPSGSNVHPVTTPQATAASSTSTGTVPAAAGSILAIAEQVANTAAGRSGYCWGGGHSNSPCSASCFDCSGYVSCVMNRAGKLKGSMVAASFMSWSGATTIPYAQRAGGDLFVSASHIGIIADSTQMWNAACTGCGPVKLSSYVGRGGYIVRRVK